MNRLSAAGGGGALYLDTYIDTSFTSGSFSFNRFQLVAELQRSVTISTISPNNGPAAGGATVTITGADLQGATGVTFGGVEGTVMASSATSVTVTTPAPTASR